MLEDWPEYREISGALADLVSNTAIPPQIREGLKHSVENAGKRSRPVMVLLCGRLCGGSSDTVMNLALATELLHTASLIHDDVIDGGVTRRKSPTLCTQFDTPVAILLGDWIICKSVDLLSAYGPDVIRDFSRAGMDMVHGEILDIRSIPDRADEMAYYTCTMAKTAELFAVSARNACRIILGEQDTCGCLYEFGRHLGLAYQLVDDLLEYTAMLGEKESLMESRTLPRIYEERDGCITAISRCLRAIREHADLSLAAISTFGPSDARTRLEELVSLLTDGMLAAHELNPAR
jgi:octaprenyl-diphosphate synthase